MINIKGLTLDERIFLAGCMKSMVMADGKIDEAELGDISDVIKSMEFEDFDECLIDFEKNITTTDEFWKKAELITSKETQELITSILEELSLQDGFTLDTETKLLSELKDTWT